MVKEVEKTSTPVTVAEEEVEKKKIVKAAAATVKDEQEVTPVVLAKVAPAPDSSSHGTYFHSWQCFGNSVQVVSEWARSGGSSSTYTAVGKVASCVTPYARQNSGHFFGYVRSMVSYSFVHFGRRLQYTAEDEDEITDLAGNLTVELLNAAPADDTRRLDAVEPVAVAVTVAVKTQKSCSHAAHANSASIANFFNKKWDFFDILVAGIVGALLLCCCCLSVCYCRKKQREKKEELAAQRDEIRQPSNTKRTTSKAKNNDWSRALMSKSLRSPGKGRLNAQGNSNGLRKRSVLGSSSKK